MKRFGNRGQYFILFRFGMVPLYDANFLLGSEVKIVFLYKKKKELRTFITLQLGGVTRRPTPT